MRRQIKFFIILFILFFLMPCTTIRAGVTIYRRTNQLGGDPNDLDGIDGDLLHEGDIAWIYTSIGDYKYDYRLNATSGAAESSPEVVSPDTNPGSKRWILQHIIYNALGGLGDMSIQDANSVAITGGSIIGITDLAIADGGTGASTAGAARTNLGLGTIAVQDANSLAITGGSITGITDLAVADGGTGGGDAATARSNLGIGTIAIQDSPLPIANGGTAGTDAATARSNLGIGTVAVQDSPLPIANGGTGATDAAIARTNLGVGGSIFGDPNGGVLRRSTLIITGIDADTINMELVCDLNDYGDFNGDTLANEDVDKNNTGDRFAVGAGGTYVTILGSGLSGSCVGIVSVSVTYNDSAIVQTGAKAAVSGSGIYVLLSNSGGSIDLCTLGAGKKIRMGICYLTAS